MDYPKTLLSNYLVIINRRTTGKYQRDTMVSVQKNKKNFSKKKKGGGVYIQYTKYRHKKKKNIIFKKNNTIIQ
jgi:hypothetical protein